MSQLGIDLIKDCIERIQLTMREDRFSKDELELLMNWFDKASAITRTTLDKKCNNTPKNP